MPLTTQSTTSAHLIKLMENYPINSPTRLTTPNMNTLKTDLLNEELMRKIDDATAQFYRQLPAQTKFDIDSVQQQKFAQIGTNSPVFKHRQDAAQTLKNFTDHVQKLVNVTQDAISSIDNQFARQQHEAKLAFDMDDFRLKKILQDIVRQTDLAQGVQWEGKVKFTAQQTVQIQLQMDRFQREISQKIAEFASTLFQVENDLKILDATQKQFLEVTCQVCGNQLRQKVPLIVSCGHGICEDCFQHFYGEKYDKIEFSLQECQVCGERIRAVCVDKVMLSRCMEQQLRMDDIIADTIEMIKDGQMLVDQYGVI